MISGPEKRYNGRDRQNRPPRKGHGGESKAEKRPVESDTVNGDGRGLYLGRQGQSCQRGIPDELRIDPRRRDPRTL